MDKAKRMPIGTISRGRKKVAEGKWVPVKKQARRTKKKAATKRPAKGKEPWRTKPVKSSIFRVASKAEFNKDPQMVGHYMARKAMWETEQKLSKYMSDPRKKALIEAALDTSASTWHYFVNKLSGKDVALLAHVARNLDKKTPAELEDYVSSRGGMLKDELTRLLEYAAYAHDKAGFATSRAGAYTWLGMKESDAKKRALKYGEGLKDRYESAMNKIWPKGSRKKMEKAKRMPIGTVSHGRKKVAEGKWVPVKQSKQGAKKPERDYTNVDMATQRRIDLQSRHEKLRQEVRRLSTVGDSEPGYYQTMVGYYTAKKQMLAEKMLKPSKVVGRGYKNPRKAAREWLEQQIQHYKKIADQRATKTEKAKVYSPTEMRAIRETESEIEKAKDGKKSEYINSDGTFKGGFDGCVRYQQNAKGLAEKNARKLCAYIGRRAGRIP